MTNMERIRTISAAEVQEMFARIRKAPGYEYLDIDAWLNSDSEEFVYKGYDVVFYNYNDHDTPIPCKVLADSTVFSKPYKTILCRTDPAAQLTIMKVPAEYVARTKGQPVMA